MKLIHNSLYQAALAPRGITVSLQSPSQGTSLQRWTFADQPVIKIGRCAHNDIVLHSSVVSRYHLEARRIATHWKIINFGNNGTYLDGQPITEAIVRDGMIIRLAISGPQLQIQLGSVVPNSRLKNELRKELVN